VVCCGYTPVSGSAYTAIGLLNDAYLGVVSTYNLAGIIGRAVIDQDNFLDRGGLIYDRLYRPAERVPAVVAGYYNRNTHGNAVI
jgi:hypothetical protein